MSILRRVLLACAGLFVFFPMLSAQDSLVQIPFTTLEELQRQTDASLSAHAKVYRTAYEIGDWATAATAAHYLLQEQPGNTFLQDSIATYYYRAGNLTACKAWSRQCLKARPEAGQLHLLLAQVLEREGDVAAALPHYEALAQATGNPYFQYQVAALQLRLQRYGECRQTAQSLLSSGSMEQLLITSSTRADQVPVSAAAWNLLGVMERELGQEREAKEAFRKALEIAPQFSLAKENLRYRPPQPEPAHGGGN